MSADTWARAAWVAYDNLNFVEAANLSALALKSAPNDTMAQACHAMASSWLEGDSDKTLRVINKLRKRAPQIGKLDISLGSAYAYRGQLGMAEAIYGDAAERYPEDPTYFYYLTSVKHYTEFDVVCERMRQLYYSGKCPPEKLVSLLFGLAKVYDDLGNYDVAMSYCEKANAERSFSYAPIHLQKYMAAAKDLNARGKFAKLSNSGIESRAPVFILGMPRSGTTLVETILGRHVRVRACGELNEIAEIEGRLIAKTVGGKGQAAPGIAMLEHVSADQLRSEGEAFLARVTAKGSGKFDVFTDKMPGNAVRMGLIAKLFPNARVIYVRRNPLDCCVSNLFARFGPSHAYATRQDWLGQYYRFLEDIVGQWEQMTDLQVLHLNYEALVADAEPETRRMLDFLGLEWSADCLDLAKGKNEVRTESVWQARQPIHQASVGRWRRYEPWIQPLIKALGGYDALGEKPANALPDEQRA